MLKFFFRLVLFGMGLFTTYTFGRTTVEPIWHRVTGTTVEGRISGFLAGRHAPSVQREPDGLRRGKRRARRPVFVYPTAPTALDSLEARSITSSFFTFSNYQLNERVTVVLAKSNPTNAHIFGGQLILTAFLVTLLGLYMIRIGVLGKLD